MLKATSDCIERFSIEIIGESTYLNLHSMTESYRFHLPIGLFCEGIKGRFIKKAEYKMVKPALPRKAPTEMYGG